MDKTAYKTQLTYPIPNTDKEGRRCCQPSGRTTVLWGAGKEYPVRGEDFAFMLFLQEELLWALISILPCLDPRASARTRSRRARRPGAEPAGRHRRGHRTRPPRNADRHRPGTSTRRGGSTACPAMPNCDPRRCRRARTSRALPQPLSRTPIDLEALARAMHRKPMDDSGAGLATEPGLLVFVSLSMPRPTCNAHLVDQAARGQGLSIVLRGFANGSLRDTVAQVQGLIGSRQVAVQIDPQAFDRFSVTRVPTFVLVRDGTRPVACASGSCAPADSFLRTSGDVSLDYALEHMRRRRPGSARPPTRP